MKVCMNGSVGHLQGELTNSAVTDSCIASLTVSLQQIASRGEKKMRIDCKRISRVDMSGLRLLYVWMQCARFRGVELQLVNLSDALLQLMETFGLGHGFTDKMVLSSR